jgi:hypothetical protein
MYRDDSGYSVYSGPTDGTGGNRYEQLATSVEHSYRSLQPFREFYRNMVNEYTGPNYGDRGKKRAKFVNKIQQAIDAYTIILAANRPQVRVTTEHLELQPFAKHFEINFNNFMKEIRIEETIRQWVLDAMLCVGIVKCHMAESGMVEREADLAADPGSPFLSNVLLDDWVHDCNGRKQTEMKFCGDMYQVTWSDLMQGIEEGIYVGDVAMSLSRDTAHGHHGRVDEISKEQGEDGYAFSPVVDLIDLWIPEEWAVVTFPIMDRTNCVMKPVEIGRLEWNGTETGPYPMLGFNDVPGNIMPSAPVAHYETLDRLANNICRKQAKRVHRSKQIPIYTASGSEAMEKIRAASDGVAVQVNSLEEVGVFGIGGADANDQAMLHDVLGLLDDQAGNLTSLLGLGAQSETVGQEQLIHAAGSRKGAQMQYRVVDATVKACHCLGKMLWDDEFKEIASTISVEGSPNMAIPTPWRAGEREGNFFMYNFDIDLDSMAYQPSSKRIDTLNSLLTNIYIPMQETLMQQGGYIDMAELSDIHAEMLNVPRLRNLVKFNSGPTKDGPGPQSSISKPSNTNRNYTRRSIPASANPAFQRGQAQQAWQRSAGNQQTTGLQRPSLTPSP